MGSDKLFRFLRRCARIEKNDDRWTSATEGRTQNPRCPCQLLQAGQQRTERSTIRLVDPIFERGCEQLVAPLHKCNQQQHGVLDVHHCIGAGILRRKRAASFFRGEDLVRDGK